MSTRRTLKLLVLTLAGGMCVAVLATPTEGATKAPRAPGERAGKGGAPGPAQNEDYAVIQIGNDGVEAIGSMGVEQRKQQVADEDKKRLKKYEDDKKALKSKNKGKAKGKTEAFDPNAQADDPPLEKPAKRKVTVLKDHIRSAAEASKLAEELSADLRDGVLDPKTVKKKLSAQPNG
jgi:hypothetical protein